MKYIHYLTCIAFTISIISGCKQKNEQKNTESESPATKTADNRIDSISVLFFNYIVSPSTPIAAEDIKKNIPDFSKDYKGVIDATISDTSKIRKIKEQIDLLQKSETTETVDARISATIYHRDGTTSKLVLGGEYGDQISYNNVAQLANNKLVFLIKNYIGYYPWFIGDDLYSMPELNDSAFPKEPFSRSDYYKQYQAALAAR